MLKLKGIFFILLIFIMIPLVQATVQQIAHFENCSGYTFFVGISGLGPIYEEGYDLAGCDFFTKTTNGDHEWICRCEDNLNLTIETPTLLNTTFKVSVLRVGDGTDYGFVETYNSKNISVNTMPMELDENITKNNLITGNVIFSSNRTWSIFGAGFIILLFAGLFLHNFMGGMLWASKRERALTLHKKGQRAFEASKLNKAKRCYKRASKLRK